MSTHTTGTIPRQDSELLAYSRLIEATCRLHQTSAEWNIDTALLQQLTDLNTAAKTALDANASLETRNHFTVAAKNAALAALRAFLSGFIDYLLGNLSVTDEGLDAMGIRPRHPVHHQPLPPPSEAPVIALVTGQHHDLDIYFYKNQAGHPTTYLADPNHYGVLLQYRFEGAPDWQQAIITKKHHTLIFDDASEGKYLQVRAAWLNPRLQQGPWSDTDKKLIN
jgi:hypothetical protein